MNATCGILINGDRILIVKLSEQTDWLLPCGEITNGVDDSIKKLMLDKLNISVRPLHAIRPHEKNNLITHPMVLEYIEGAPEFKGYTHLKFVNKSESKKVRIDILHRSIVATFFDSYSIFLRKDRN